MSTSPQDLPKNISEIVTAGAAIAATADPALAPVIAAGVELEPEVYTLISALIHFFHKKKVAVAPVATTLSK